MIGAVAVMLEMDRTTLTAALKPLQRRDLINVTIDPEDRSSSLQSPGGSLSRMGGATHEAAEARLGACNPDQLRAGLVSRS